MSTTTTFTGFSPEHPQGRSFNLWKFVPRKNRVEDLTRDLARFINVLKEITELQLIQIDHFTDLFDPDLCSDQVIDDMLLDMGNPFDWADLDLNATQRRKLLRILIEIYKSKGTAVGIENTILFLLGVEADVVLYTGDGWILGIDELGSGSIAQIGNLYVGPYDFTSIAQPWTATFSVDGEAGQVVTFVPGDFANTATATVAEVVAVITAQLNGAGAYKINDGEPAIMIGGTEPFALSGGEALQLDINGVPYEFVFSAVDFDTPGAAELEEVLIALQGQFLGLDAIDDPSGGLGLYTRLRGATAEIEIINDPGNTAAVPLGFSLGATATGVDGERLFVYSETAGREASIECTSIGNLVDGLLGFWPGPVGSTGGAVLAPSDSYTLYSFDVETIALVSAQTQVLIRRIAEYMKCAHEHLIEIREALPLPWPDGWEIGVSELDTEAELAE